MNKEQGRKKFEGFEHYFSAVTITVELSEKARLKTDSDLHTYFFLQPFLVPCS